MDDNDEKEQTKQQIQKLLQKESLVHLGVMMKVIDVDDKAQRRRQKRRSRNRQLDSI